MSLTIENPQKINLSAAQEQVLRTMLAAYRRVIIRKEFVRGLSGGRVLEVQPIKADGIPELPGIIKLATISVIQKEWQAYRQHIRDRLPNIPQIRREPTVLPEIGWGGLRYTLMGGSSYEVVSLRHYCGQSHITANNISQALDELLLKIMRHIWSYNFISPKFRWSNSFDRLLPVNLLIQHHPLSSAEQPFLITPDHLPIEPLKVGDRVRVSGFAVNKVNPVTQTMTLDRPHLRPELSAYRLRYKSEAFDQMATYRLHQITEPLEGQVIETRTSRLQDEIRYAFGESFDPAEQTVPLPEGNESRLPNPLHALDTILNEVREVKSASIHGDLNLENILVEPETGRVSLIDFAETREDYVLHDLLRLETDVMIQLVPEILYRHDLPLVPTLTTLYWQLHEVAWQTAPTPPNLPHPDLEKPWVMLATTRRTAREYLVDPDDLSEYYQGLMLHLLGALKFKNLNDVPEQPLPKQVAFWAATLIYQFLTSLPSCRDAPPPLLAPIIDAQPQVTVTSPETDSGQAPVAVTPAEAEQKLAVLPLKVIPTVAPLPSRSRMPLSRNPLFVGRERDLRNLAKTLKGGKAIAIGRIETAAMTGLGGIGKTQLASEFVHRYGQFFGGGVFWLSFADPKAVPAEIAACGGAGAMELRPNFGELSLEDQVRLVMAAWQESMPRLLVFDNCEDPDLLSLWRPTSGGCRVLVTSRRADWEATLGVQTLPLDVLNRSESIALLREHQPDASDEILDAIADELGDLPLALHLAGSYMARYRRTITPAQYLKQLRDPALLQHRSLKGLGISPTGHVQNVRRAIALSYDQLDPNNEIDN